MGTTPSRLAIAFALSNSCVASALFGATSPEQVGDNMGVLDVLGEMSDLDLARLREIRTAAAQ